MKWKILVFGTDLAFVADSDDKQGLTLKQGPENAKWFDSYDIAADASKAFVENATQVRLISDEFDKLAPK